MRAIVTGGAGFIGSHVVDALVARGDEVHRPRQPLDRPARERQPRAPGSSRRTSPPRRRRVRRRPAGDRASISLRRRTCAFRSSGRTSTPRSTCSGRSTCSRQPAATGRRSSSPRPEARSTANATAPRDEDSPRRPLAPVRRRRSSPPRSTWRRTTACTETGHVALRYGNVYGPRQDPHGEAGRRRHLPGPARARQNRSASSETGARPATTSTSGTSWRRRSPPGSCRRVQRRDRDRDVRSRARRRPASASRGVDVEIEHASAAAGELQRSVLDPAVPSGSSAFEPATSLEEGLAATWKFVREAEGEGADRGELDAPRGSRLHPSRQPIQPLAHRRDRRGGRRGGRALHPRSHRRRLRRQAPTDKAEKAIVTATSAKTAARRRRRRPRPRRRRRRPRRSRPDRRRAPARKTSIVVLNGNGLPGAAAVSADACALPLHHRRDRKRAPHGLPPLAGHVPQGLQGRGASAWRTTSGVKRVTPLDGITKAPRPPGRPPRADHRRVDPLHAARLAAWPSRCSRARAGASRSSGRPSGSCARPAGRCPSTGSSASTTRSSRSAGSRSSAPR